MAFYEIIYEPGTFSVANYATNEEALAAVEAHNSRAVKAEIGGPSGHRAERVVRVLKYDKHPSEYNVDQTMGAEVALESVREAVESTTESGVVSVPVLAAAVRDMTNPVADTPPHESNFKMPETEELTLPWVGGK